MLQGFWGGVILSVVNQGIVFLVLGGLAAVIVVVRTLVASWERRAPASQPRPADSPVVQRTPPRGTRPQHHPRIAAIVAAVYAFADAPPGTLRVVGVARVGADGLWKAVGRMEAVGMEIRNSDRFQ